MATFTGQLISATYDAILKTVDNDPIGAAAKQITDGLGNVTPLYISTTQIGIGITPTEVLHVSGNIKATGTLTIDSDATIDGNISFDSLTGIGVAVTINKFVSQADGIASNDNDTTLPTSAAVKDYVDTKAALTDTLEEVLALGNTTGGTNISITAGDKITTFESTGIDDNATSTALTIDSSQNSSFAGELEVTSTITATSYIQTDSNVLIKGDIKFRNVADTSWNGGQIGADSNDALRFAVQNAGSSNVQALLIDTSLNASFTGTVTAPTFLGDLNGTINTLTTAVTQAASNNSTLVATTAYVDGQIGTVDTLEEVLAIGNTTGGTNISITAGDKITTFESTGIDDNAISTALTIDSSNQVIVTGNTDNSAEFLTIDDADTTVGSQRPHIKFTGAGSQIARIEARDNSFGMSFLNSSDEITLRISDLGNSTFEGRISIDGTPSGSGDTRAVLSIDEENDAEAGRGGGLTFGRQNNIYGGIKTVQNTSSDDDATMTFQTIGGGTLANRLTIDESGNSTFTGSVTATNFIGTLPTGQFLPLIGGTLTGALTGTTAAFNSGGTNVVASFTSTDPTGVIQIVDENGNVEIGAFGNNFVVQPVVGKLI